MEGRPLPPPVAKRGDGRLKLVPDAIMELGALEAIEKILGGGERLDAMTKGLVDHYGSYQQIVNTFMDWLEDLGQPVEEEEEKPPEPVEEKTKKGKQKGRKPKKKEVEQPPKELPKEEPSTSKAPEPTTPQTATPPGKNLTIRTAFGDHKLVDRKQVWSTWQWHTNANIVNSGKELPPLRRTTVGLLSPTGRRDSTGGLMSPNGSKSGMNFSWNAGKLARKRTISTSVDEPEPDAKNDAKKEEEIEPEEEPFNGREEAEKCVENSLSSIIIKNFDQSVADGLFSGGGGIDWLPDLIKFRRWRQLLYDLIESYPSCLMLNFAVKLVSDAGYQDEISNASVALACGQLDIFTKVFVSTFDKVLKEHRHGSRTVAYEKAFGYLTSIVCQHEHTYFLVQCALTQLYNSLAGPKRAACRQVAEELRGSLKAKEYESHSQMYSLMLSDDYIPDEILTALLNMMSRRELNPADITHIYEDFITPRPVSIEVIRDFTLIDMLIDALFHCDGPRATLEFRDMYIYLLAYVGSIAETGSERFKTSEACGDFAATREALAMTVAVLETSDDLTRDSNVIEVADRPVVAMGILYYVHTLLMSENTRGELLPVCLTLMDQLATKHAKLRPRIFRICQQLFSKVTDSQEVAEVIMDRQKLVLDRLVHLFSEGEVVSVLEKIAAWFGTNELDVSLVRYFVTEILDMIGPPYSEELVKYMLPLADNLEVFDEISRYRNPSVLEFLRHCGRLDEEPEREKEKEKEKKPHH